MTGRRKAELRERSLLAVGLLILSGYVAWSLYSDHNRIENSERDRLATQAKVVDQNLERQLNAANNALMSLQAAMPDVPKDKRALQIFNDRLQSLAGAMPGVRSLFIIDSQGIAIACNRVELVGRDYAEREYFETARESNDPSVLHVASPRKSNRGTYTINLVRSTTDGAGRFTGLVGASLEPEYFTTLLSSVLYASDMSAALVHGDGTLFVVYPDQQFSPGYNLATPHSFFSRHVESGQIATVLTGKTFVTQKERMMAQRTLRSATPAMDNALLVSIARDMTAIDAPWRHDVALQAAWLGLLTVISWGTLLLFQQRQRQFSDIAALHEQERDRLAFYDPLTSLPNRRFLLDRLQKTKAASLRSGREAALMFIDLDDFKTVNDMLGHDVGDVLLQKVAERLASCIRENDTVARLGGDEFVVVLEDLNPNAQAAAGQVKKIGQKILAALNQPYITENHNLRSTPSIGATLFSQQPVTVHELLRRADLAMYQAKAAGRNCLRFFELEMQRSIEARVALEGDLRRAIADGHFVLFFQPQVDEFARVTGAEALIRWQHPARGMISPGAFIPLAEETGLILPLGQWVLEAACKQIVSWATQPITASLTVAVNVSAHQFRQDDFVDQVIAIAQNAGADPRKIKLELTESMLVDNVEDIIVKMNTLKEKGFCFSLDDFGTGYSSLSYLKRLPLSQLKIDQSFVRDVITDPNDASIARTIIALANGMGLKVIAEGVETDAQYAFLKHNGCLAYQGHFFGHPLPAEEFLANLVLQRGRATAAPPPSLSDLRASRNSRRRYLSAMSASA